MSEKGERDFFLFIGFHPDFPKVNSMSSYFKYKFTLPAHTALKQWPLPCIYVLISSHLK